MPSALVTDLLSSCFPLLLHVIPLLGLLCHHTLLLRHTHPPLLLASQSAQGVKALSLELGYLGLNSAFASYHYQLRRFMTLGRFNNLPKAQFPCV